MMRRRPGLSCVRAAGGNPHTQSFTLNALHESILGGGNPGRDGTGQSQDLDLARALGLLLTQRIGFERVS